MLLFYLWIQQIVEHRIGLYKYAKSLWDY